MITSSGDKEIALRKIISFEGSHAKKLGMEKNFSTDKSIYKNKLKKETTTNMLLNV